MKRYCGFLAVLACGLALASCSSIEDVLRAEQLDLPASGKRIISTTAGKRHTIISDRSGRTIVCTEPPPDAATSADVDIDFDLSLVKLSGDDKNDDDQDLEQDGLGGRSANVLMVRDLLYRTCELFMNSSFTDDQKAGLFRDVLKTIERIGPAKVEQGTPPGQRAPVTLPMATTSDTGRSGGKSGSKGRSDRSDGGGSGAAQACASNPEGKDCGDYCSQNSSTTICSALCASTGDYYGWCTN